MVELPTAAAAMVALPLPHVAPGVTSTISSDDVESAVTSSHRCPHAAVSVMFVVSHHSDTLSRTYVPGNGFVATATRS